MAYEQKIKELEREIRLLESQRDYNRLDFQSFFEIGQKIQEYHMKIEEILYKKENSKKIGKRNSHPKSNSKSTRSSSQTSNHHNQQEEDSDVNFLRAEKKIQIDSFGIDTISSRENLLRDMNRFEEDFQDVLDTKAQKEQLLEEIIKKFLPNHSSRNFLILNRSLRDNGYIFGVRPVPSNLSIRFKEKSISFSFTVTYPKFQLTLGRIQPIFNQPRRTFEVEARLGISLNEKSINKKDRAILQQEVPPQGLEVKKRLEDWTAFLTWKRKKIEANQFWIPYFDFTTNNDTQILSIYGFMSSNEYKAQARKLRNLREEEMLAADLKQSKSNAKWIWEPKNYPKFESIGELMAVDKTTTYDKEKINVQKLPAGSDTIILKFDFDLSAMAGELNLESIPKQGFLLNSIIGDIYSIQIQQTGIKRLQEFEAVNNQLCDFIFDSQGAQLPLQRTLDNLNLTFLRDDLNINQQNAVKKGIAAPDIMLMQGPPGTGKTTTIAEICNYYSLQNKRVIISSQTNLAVDNALSCLIDKNYIFPMRIGDHSTEFGDKFLKKNVLHSWIETVSTVCQEEYKKHQQIFEELSQLQKLKADMKARKEPWDKIRPINAQIEKIEQSFKKELDTNTLWAQIQSELMQKYEEFLSTQKKPDASLEPIYEQNVNILGLTCAEAGNKKHYHHESFKPYDLVIVDEVSRATPPELLLPLLLGKKIILMGDHRQLPPIFKERRYEDADAHEHPDVKYQMENFEKMVTSMLFNDLFQNADSLIKETLQTQYRFHPQIMEIVNQFYQDTPLNCGINDPDNTRAHNLAIPNIIQPSNHVLWIDSSRDMQNQFVREELDRSSKYNEFEIELMVFFLGKLNQNLKDQGYSVDRKKKIGIITFYGAQVKRIRNKIRLIRQVQPEMIETMDIRYNTVDKFQGMERDIVLVSLVRTSKSKQGLEFVRNYQRINVAFSRAKELLVMFGNAEAYQNYSVEVINQQKEKEEQKVYNKIIQIVKNYNGFVRPQQMEYQLIEFPAPNSNKNTEEKSPTSDPSNPSNEFDTQISSNTQNSES